MYIYAYIFLYTYTHVYLHINTLVNIHIYTLDSANEILGIQLKLNFMVFILNIFDKLFVLGKMCSNI